MGLTAEQALGASLKKIKGISSGFDHATKTGDNTFSIYFTDGSKVDLTIPTPADGVSVTDVDVDSSNHLICTMSDASTIDAGLLPSTKVSVSKDTGNALVEKTDGLYVSSTGVQVSAETGNTLVTKADGLYVPATDISGKVDKVTGKGLSTNDYDATEKAEVAKVKDKLDANKVVTSFSATTLDTNVPSEKLVKGELDTITQELAKKVAIAQGEANKGKALIVGNDGNVTCGTVATDNLTIVDKTQAQYDVLTDAEKNDASKLYNITDADDLDLTNYVKMPSISSSAILHTFATNESWTATEDCWLIGMIRYVNSTQGDNDSSIKVNSIFVQTAYCSSGNALTNVSMPISKGDVVSTSTYGTFNALKAYRCK